jgi:hypothetical protein
MKRLLYTVVALVAGLAFLPTPAVATTARAGTRPAAVFTKTWYGHTRYLRIGPKHRAHEEIYDGCCDHVINVTLRLRHFRGTRAHGSARAIVVAVRVFDRSAFSKKNPPPHKGQRGLLRLRHGVLSEPFTQTIYCDERADKTGACGA